MRPGYWTEGELQTTHPQRVEWYATCRRCGAFVNADDRHDDWHAWLDVVADRLGIEYSA